MAWVCLKELEASHSDLKNGSEPSPTANLTPIARVSSYQEWLTDYCPAPLYGMILKRSKESSFPKNSSISFMEASHARISVLQGLARGWLASEADFILKSKGSLATFDRHSYSWKTYQLSLFGGLTELAWTSLRSGMIVDGRLYQPTKLEPRISEKGGFVLPTPTASDYRRNRGARKPIEETKQNPRDRWSLSIKARLGELPNHPKGRLNPEYLEQMMGFPTAWTELSAWGTQFFLLRREKPLGG